MLLTLLFACGGPALAAAPPLPLAEYRQVIAGIQRDLDQLSAQPPADVPARLSAIAGQLSAISALALPDGSEIPIDHSFLTAQLTAEPTDMARLRALFAALLDTIDAASGSTMPQDSLATLERILADPQFQWREERPSPLQEWLKNLYNRILAWLRNLFPGTISGDVSILNIVIAGASVLALVVILAYTLKNIWGAFAAESELEQNGDPTGAQITSASALQQAQSFSQQGDHRMAVRYLYLSTLLLMEERGLLRYDRSKTNLEYLESIRDHPQLTRVFGSVVQVFDRVWYGYRPIDQETFDRYAEQVAGLQRMRP